MSDNLQPIIQRLTTAFAGHGWKPVQVSRVVLACFLILMPILLLFPYQTEARREHWGSPYVENSLMGYETLPVIMTIVAVASLGLLFLTGRSARKFRVVAWFAGIALPIVLILMAAAFVGDALDSMSGNTLFSGADVKTVNHIGYYLSNTLLLGAFLVWGVAFLLSLVGIFAYPKSERQAGAAVVGTIA